MNTSPLSRAGARLSAFRAQIEASGASSADPDELVRRAKQLLRAMDAMSQGSHDLRVATHLLVADALVTEAAACAATDRATLMGWCARSLEALCVDPRER